MTSQRRWRFDLALVWRNDNSSPLLAGFLDRGAFVGRVAELEAIIDALATDEGRSIADVALEKVSLGELDPVNAL